ncbi:unnamed protein product, partial [Iphiclides podalirius]
MLIKGYVITILIQCIRLPEVVLVGQQSIPTINLNRMQQSLLTFVEIDHSYSCPRREYSQSKPLANIFLELLYVKCH